MTRFVTVLFALLVASAAGQRPSLKEYKEGKADEAAASKAKADDDAKMSAVNKAVELLKTLTAKVLEEGELEAASYNKFACFCKDTTTEKSESIKKGQDEQQELMAEITKLQSDRDGYDDSIKKAQEDIEKTEGEMRDAEASRAATLAEYKANEKDLAGAIFALEGAIKTLKGSKTPSLLQFQKVSDTVKTAALLADAMGIGSKGQQKSLAMFLQQPENGNAVPMEDYKFHSGDIIATLEQLLKDFKDEKNSVDADEVESVQAHNMLMEEKNNFVKQTTKAMEEAKKARENCISDIEMASKELSTTEATLLEDQEYMNKLAKMCRDKAITWDQRSKVRQDELATLTQAQSIISGKVSEKTASGTVRFNQQGVSLRVAKYLATDSSNMEALEAEAEEADAPSFVQKKMLLKAVKQVKPEDGRTVVSDLLASKGKELKSTLLSALASKISSVSGADPFAKIKTLIQELIERLLQEAAAEANQKGWCDKAMADASQKRDYAAEEIMALNSEMAKLEAVRDQLTEDLAGLDKDIKELKDTRDKASKQRSEESDENKATVLEAQEGLDALQMCIQILDRFYKTVKKEKVDLSLKQQADPMADAPDAGFDNGEAYTGAQGEAGGILGMLDVMKSDFERTISETESAEAEAKQDHLEFMTETGKSLAEKEQAHEEKTSQKDDALEKLEKADEDLDSETSILQGAISELMELKPTCIDTGMSYEERVARREEEIAALKKAQCILEAYAEYGPEGAAGSC